MCLSLAVWYYFAMAYMKITTLLSRGLQVLRNSTTMVALLTGKNLYGFLRFHMLIELVHNLKELGSRPKV